MALLRETGARRSLAILLNNMGNLAFFRRDYATARANFIENLAIRREIGDKYGIASGLANLAAVSKREGNLESARAQLSRESRSTT